MTELVAAAALMGVVLFTTVPMLSSITRMHRDSAQRQLAVREVGNLLEHVAAARLADTLTPDDFNRLAVSHSAAQSLTNHRLAVAFADFPGPPAAQQVTVSLTWTNDAGEEVVPVEVTMFLHEPGGAQ